jgi:heat shock protein HtpX
MATINTAWDHVSENIWKTWLIMALFTVFVMAVVYVFARAWGFDEVGAVGILGIAMIVTGVINFGSYYFSDQIVLGISGAKAVEVDGKGVYGQYTAKELYRLVENLALAAGLPTPKVYTIDDTAPNAFATGRDPKHAAVAFTTGILSKLNKQELEGVTAHELSHVGNRDTLMMAVVSVLVGTVALMADFFFRSTLLGSRDSNDSKGNGLFIILAIVSAILAPLIAELIKLAVSRRREYLADASGVLLTRNPDSLISALSKISGDKEALEVANRGTAHLYIVNPLKGEEAKQWLAGMFNTHPPMAERIKALEEMKGRV